MDNRLKIQTEAIEAWVNNGKKGTVVLVTGTGKTYCGVLVASKQLESGRIKNAAVVVPTVNLIEQ